MIRGAIFDLDGTLVDSEQINAESDAAFLAEYGIAFEILPI
jgi:beta-phosphoglucomutase-like phosphatase (HAD superfamily)